MAQPLETIVSNGRLGSLDREYAQSRRQVGRCVQLDHVRDWNREEQKLRNGPRDQSRLKFILVNRASSREISAPTTFVSDLFSTGTDFQRFFLNRAFSDDAVFFGESSRNLVHPGKWSDSRGDALATGVFALSCQKPSTSAKRETTLGIARF